MWKGIEGKETNMNEWIKEVTGMHRGYKRKCEEVEAGKVVEVLKIVKLHFCRNPSYIGNVLLKGGGSGGGGNWFKQR